LLDINFAQIVISFIVLLFSLTIHEMAHAWTADRLGDPTARKETARALARATGFFRRQIGARLQLRRVPELEFRFDESIAHQDRIEQILRDIHEEDAQRAAQFASSAGSAAEPVEARARPTDSPDDDGDRN
jgi:hypothetical protein